MAENKPFDVIVVGGSYSGLAAGMALGRALIKTLIIESGEPCNKQTPQSHNFLTQDGNSPAQISALGNQQVQQYSSVEFFGGLAIEGRKTENGFEIRIASGEAFQADKLIFATGIKDILPNIEGVEACWGISVLHCPYCHGYEVRNERTGILGNGEYGYEFSRLISNWTNDLTLFTNGASTLTDEQARKLESLNIKIVEGEIKRLEHSNGNLQNVVLISGGKFAMKAVYVHCQFDQHCKIPKLLGCELTEDGYIRVDPSQETTVSGVFACGDNVSRMRTVANAVAMGTTAGMTVSKKIILDR